MKAIHLLALAAGLAAAACRSATSTASLAPVEPAPAPAFDARAPDTLPEALASALQEPTEIHELEQVEQPEQESVPDGWRFAISPNVYYAGANGAVDVDNDGEDVGSETRDVLDSPDLGGILGLELGHSDSSWKALADLIYLGTEEDGTSASGDPAEIDLEQFLAELAVGLELQPEGLVDLYFGARFWSVSADLEVDFGPPTGVVSADASETWVDPVIGLRSRLPLCSSLDVLLRGDVAGFGLGSEFSSHFAAGLDWSFAKSLSLGGGYRQYYVNYSAGALDYDFKFGGLYLGLTWRM